MVFFLYLISVGVQELWQYLTIVSLSTLKGYVDGVVVSYIVTDALDNKTATSITEGQGRTINFAPLLVSLSNQYLQQGYDFLNGISGEGPFGF